MANQQQQQYTARRNNSFIPLNQLPQGTGESGSYVTNVTGVLLGIEPRDGYYTITDRNTGQEITRPNSWTAHFADGSMFSWPTYLDDQGQVRMWSRFDPSINLAQVIQQGIVIHLWKDKRNFTHLEIAQQQTQMQQQPAPQQNYVPWE